MRFISILLLALPLAAQTSDHDLARDIYKQLIEINTTDSVGDNTAAANAMAARFRAAGFPDADIRVLSPSNMPKKGNLVVRLHGTGTAKPVLFIGHLDVVEAKREDWSFDPFKFREEGGYFYGRGTEDMKGDVTTLIAAFLRLKREGVRPTRDLILALTSDEEGGPGNGVEWLMKEHRDLIDAAYCINADAGGGHIKKGKHIFMALEAAEKVFLSFKLEVTNPGGHSSRPSKNNAIYHLAAGLTRLAAFDFPVHLFDVTRIGLERSAQFQDAALAADMRAVAKTQDPAAIARLSKLPNLNAQLRTTCVATMLAGGHAENALPQLATAIVNCRLLPVDKPADIRATLERVLADPDIHLSEVKPPIFLPYTPISPEVLKIATAATEKLWPGLAVVPWMETGATDNIYLVAAGIPCYGVSGMFGDEDDNRAHGKDERVLVASFYQAVDYMYDIVTRVAAQ